MRFTRRDVFGLLPAASALALSGAAEAGEFRAPPRRSGPTINVRDFGAVGDGVTDDTHALQRALDSASALFGPELEENESPSLVPYSVPIYFPAGVYRTGTLVWRAQSLYGDGRRSILLGQRGEDILRASDDPVWQYAFQHGYVRDLAFMVDDSVDVSPFAGRGGIGNAAMAFELNDARDSPHRWEPDGSFVNLWFQGLSGQARNNSCGMFVQRAIYGANFQQVTFMRLAYGYQEVAPDRNVASMEWGSDHNSFESLVFNGCDYSFRALNGERCYVQNMQIYNAGKIGFEMAAIRSLSRSEPGGWTVNGLFVEDCRSGRSLALSGAHHYFAECIVAPHKGSDIAIGCTRSRIVSSFLECSEHNRIRITGDQNLIDNCTFRAPGLIDDRGKFNHVVARNYMNFASAGNAVESRNKLTVFQRDAASSLLGHTDRLFLSALDLLIAPDDIVPAEWGKAWSVGPDPSLELGRCGRLGNGGGLWFKEVNRRTLKIGDSLPAAHARIYIKARVADGSARQYWYGAAGKNVGGSKTVTWTDQFRVDWFDIDLSGSVPGDALEIGADKLSAGNWLELAWILVRPFARDVLVDDAVEYGAGPRHRAGIGPPTEGAYRQGDVVFNARPVPGGSVGWVCVVDGRPGTWKPFGPISG